MLIFKNKIHGQYCDTNKQDFETDYPWPAIYGHGTNKYSSPWFGSGLEFPSSSKCQEKKDWRFKIELTLYSFHFTNLCSQMADRYLIIFLEKYIDFSPLLPKVLLAPFYKIFAMHFRFCD